MITAEFEIGRDESNLTFNILTITQDALGASELFPPS